MYGVVQDASCIGFLRVHRQVSPISKLREFVGLNFEVRDFVGENRQVVCICSTA
jgi:hypothetical protein